MKQGRCEFCYTMNSWWKPDAIAFLCDECHTVMCRIKQREITEQLNPAALDQVMECLITQASIDYSVPVHRLLGKPFPEKLPTELAFRKNGF